ncbi:hypothetical protein ABPG75_011017 [Micractinium tetrahymenae]
MSPRRKVARAAPVVPAPAGDPSPPQVPQAPLAQPAGPCLIEDLLPDELLGTVFALLGKAAGPQVSLVCRRWSRVLFSPDAAKFWGEHTIDSNFLVKDLVGRPQLQAEWTRHKLAQLTRVGPCISAFFLRDVNNALAAAATRATGAPWQAAQALQPLSPAMLRTVGLALNPLTEAVLPAAELGCLSRFTGLRSLQLITIALPAAHAIQITALAGSLQELLCRVGVMPVNMLPAVASLAGLTRLELESVAPAAGDMSQLTALSALRHLKVESVEPGTPAQPGAVAGLAPPPPSAFPALESFELACASGSALAGGARFSRACFSTGALPISEFRNRPLGQLSIVGLSGCPSLDALLSALLPPAPPFDCLHLERGQLAAAALSTPCARLAPLRALRMHYLHSGFGQLGAALGPLLSQAPKLTALELFGQLGFEGMPECIVQQEGLRWLRLRQNYLEDLPPGPYLESLTYLDYSDNNGSLGKRLPPALAGCACLEHLDLGKNSKVLIRASDADTLLAMPRLRRLSVGVAMADRTAAYLRSEATCDELIIEQPAGK